MEAREFLVSVYLDFFNNYLTVEKYAEHNGLTDEQANFLVTLARNVAMTKHPEA